jgi:hypothetical protein
MAGVPPRGTPYNPLVVDVMEEVFGPTAGEDRPLLHPRAQPVVRSLLEIAADNPRFEAVQHACPSAFLSHANHAMVRLEWLRHHLSCESHGSLYTRLLCQSRLGIYLPTIYPLSINYLCRHHVHRASQRHIPPPPSPQPGRPCRRPPTHLTKMTVVTSCVVAQLVEGGTAPPPRSAKAVGATAGVTLRAHYYQGHICSFYL